MFNAQLMTQQSRRVETWNEGQLERVSVFLTDPLRVTTLGFSAPVVLATIQAHCDDEASAETETCHFEPIHFETMPRSMLIIDLSDLCLYGIEMLDAYVVASVKLQPPGLVMNFSMRQEDTGKISNVGLIKIFSYVDSANIIFELETLMHLDTHDLKLKPVPTCVDNDTEIVIMMPETSVRPVLLHFDEHRFIHHFAEYMYRESLFVVAFECKQEVDDVCLPAVVFVMYNWLENSYSFNDVSVHSQHAVYRLKK